MRKNKILSGLTVAIATVSLFFAGCEDDVSSIGNSISSAEVTIKVDSLKYNLEATTIQAPAIESRSNYTLLGSISVPEYGDLSCSYVTQFLPAETLSVPDSITVDEIDSVKVILTVPKTYITGDTLALQQMKVFSLTKQLPSDITASFNPEGYYNPSSPLATKSYNLAGYTFGDTVFSSSTYADIQAKLPVEMGRDIFNAYKKNPEMFVWPQQFAQSWPGIYVAPSFGKGCIAAIQNTSVYLYYPMLKMTPTTDEDGKVEYTYEHVPDSICVFSTAPEVLSSINISYTPSQKVEDMVAEGKSVITTPGGYTVKFRFPAHEILSQYWKEEYDLGVINSLKFSIPAKVISNSYGLGIAPALLMVKSSEVESFFSEGKLPDNMNSFYSIYSSETLSFSFNSMRRYIVELRNKGEQNITDEDIDFTLIPVTVATEDTTDLSTGNTVTQVTSITPYTIMPTMAELDTENAEIVFTFSNETLF